MGFFIPKVFLIYSPKGARMSTITANMSEPNFKNRTLWTSDNLDIMRGMNSGSVDLIYFDPPFNSKKDYAAHRSDEGCAQYLILHFDTSLCWGAVQPLTSILKRNSVSLQFTLHSNLL